MLKTKIIVTFLLSIVFFFTSHPVWADTQSDLSKEEAISLIRDYEKAYIDKDLDRMLKYVDQGSVWFKKGFVEEFRAIFKTFSKICLYHYDEKVEYLEDGVEINQNTIYVAYSPLFSDLNEFLEKYQLKKVNGQYKIAECIRVLSEDVIFIDKGTAGLWENNIEKATTYFKKSIEVNPNNSVAHCRLGGVYLATRQLEEAIDEVRKAKLLRPEVGYYRFMLAQAYNLKGDQEEAEDEFKMAFIFDSGLKEVFGKFVDKIFE